MYRPGGMSSEEDDWDDDYFSTPAAPISVFNESLLSHQVSIEAQFLDSVKNRDLVRIKEFLSKGVDVNYKPSDNWNALIHASSFGCFDLVHLLVENGAEVNCSHEKFTPLLAVCSSPSKDEDELLKCLTLLLSKGGLPNVYDWYRVSALSHAVRRGHRNLVEKLLEASVDIDAVDQDGWSPIFYAVDKGNTDLVVMLKDFGADIYIIDKMGRTLVDLALEKEYLELVKILSGGDFDSSTESNDYAEKGLSTIKLISSKFPLEDDRLSGFAPDVDSILTAVQLNHLLRVFHDNDIGLGHLLTITEKDLKNIGVRFWFERRKILRSVENFHEHPWCMSSFGNTLSQNVIDLVPVAQLVATVSRQLYLISVSTFWWSECGGIDRGVKTLPDDLKESLITVHTLRSKIRSLKNIVHRIDNKQIIVPSDIILPIKDNNNSYNVKLFFRTALTGCVLYCTYKFSIKCFSLSHPR